MTCTTCDGNGFVRGEYCPDCVKKYKCPKCGKGLCWNQYDEEIYCDDEDCDWTAIDGYCQDAIREGEPR